MGQSRYILHKRVARGGMAEIFLGKAVGEDDFQRIVAIKRILPHYAQDREFIEMFRGEASICKRLQHANIVQVYDFKEVEGSYAIIMEFVDGTDLRSVLAACEKARTRLTVPMIIYIVAHAARGLHYAHSKIDPVTRKPLEIVHRDISPQNLLVSYEGEVKVIDFGIAKFEADGMETKPGVVKGKYSYMSPEQVTAKGLDPRTDVFSLSIVFWEALAMKRLFAGETEVDTIKNVQNAVISKSLQDLNQDVDADLMQIIYKGLAKDRSKRYQSAAAFEKDLQRYLNSRYPEFNASELGKFLQQLLSKERNESQDNIKAVLSSTSPPAADLNSQSQMPFESNSEIESYKYSGSYRAVGQDTHHQPVARSSKGLDLQLKDEDLNSKSLMGRNAIGRPNANRQKGAPQSSPFSALQRPNLSAIQSQQASGVPIRTTAKKNTNTMIMISAASLVALLLGVGTVVVKGILRPPATKAIVWVAQTTPERVRISVNQQRLFGGRHIETPLSKPFKVPPGKHQFQFSRDGYRSKVFKVDAEAGKTYRIPTVTLGREPSFSAAKLRIRSKSKIWVNIDDGFYEGLAPVEVDGLRNNASHKVILSSQRGKNKNGIKCRIRLSSRNPNVPYIIKVDTDNKGNPTKCRVETK